MSSIFKVGDRVQIQDEKGRFISFTLATDATFHTHKGFIEHNKLIGSSEGIIVKTNSGQSYQAFKPLYSDFVLGMPRGATIIYPKDSAMILGYGDVRPGMRILEAGVGSGALSIAILKTLNGIGELVSYEIRQDFADNAGENVANFFGEPPNNHRIVNQNLSEASPEESFDRVILDMLAPWEHVSLVAKVLKAGGVFICYVATTTQLSRIAEEIKASGLFTEPESFETLLRHWHHEGLAVRPAHSMNGHTGFLTFARRVHGEGPALKRKRRPAKGAEDL
jgi:tRNA (adenine57-N1/adenine58-N1)-methyltransferase catalytic subunit